MVPQKIITLIIQSNVTYYFSPYSNGIRSQKRDEIVHRGGADEHFGLRVITIIVLPTSFPLGKQNPVFSDVVSVTVLTLAATDAALLDAECAGAIYPPGTACCYHHPKARSSQVGVRGLGGM